ncbi:hypothetical protein NRF20_38010 [Streptomyces sp. R-74717]|uniref:hypothetical protein n=1 Tax=Streptomyces sp. R-74717 TaxID=2969820 RepID=UPI0039B6E6A6
MGLRTVRVRPPRTSRSWMVEAFPGADGDWDLVTTWRADVLSPADGRRRPTRWRQRWRN